jgi:hypothetical protein
MRLGRPLRDFEHFPVAKTGRRGEVMADAREDQR